MKSGFCRGPKTPQIATHGASAGHEFGVVGVVRSAFLSERIGHVVRQSEPVAVEDVVGRNAECFELCDSVRILRARGNHCEIRMTLQGCLHELEGIVIGSPHETSSTR